MKLKHMDKLINHFDYYFEQEEPKVYHNDNMYPHIDILRYKPTLKYPFYKLVTMGASDYKLSKKDTIGRYNEYMVFVDKEATDDELRWYVDLLDMIALFPFESGESLSYGHSLELPSDFDDCMKGAVITMPMIIRNTGILKCKLGFREVICLQIIPLTKEELDYKLKNGFQAIEEVFYPSDKTEKDYHYLAERVRSFKVDL